MVTLLLDFNVIQTFRLLERLLGEMTKFKMSLSGNKITSEKFLDDFILYHFSFGAVKAFNRL